MRDVGAVLFIAGMVAIERDTMLSRRTLHLVTGWLAVAVFLGTGVYMATNFPTLYVANESIRYLFRANHIYILMSGLVNLMAALGSRSADRGWRIVCSWASTISLLMAPCLLTAAFFIEPIRGGESRALTRNGIIALATGVLLAQISNIRSKPMIESDVIRS